MPGISRTGRMLAYCWKLRRIGISRPQSETWSGTVGKPTAPRKIASWWRIWSSAVLRHHPAVLRRSSRSSTAARPTGSRGRTCGRRLQHPDALRHHLFADAVAGDHRDLLMFIRRSPSAHCGRRPGFCSSTDFPVACKEGQQTPARRPSSGRERIVTSSYPRPPLPWQPRPCRRRGRWCVRSVAPGGGKRRCRPEGLQQPRHRTRGAGSYEGCRTALTADPLVAAVSPRTRRRPR